VSPTPLINVSPLSTIPAIHALPVSSTLLSSDFAVSMTLTDPIRYRTIRYQSYQIPKLSDTKAIRYQSYWILNLSDTEAIRYRTYQILKLSYWIYQIGTYQIPNLSDTEPIRYQTYQIPNQSDNKPIKYRTYQVLKLSDTANNTAKFWFCSVNDTGRSYQIPNHQILNLLDKEAIRYRTFYSRCSLYNQHGKYNQWAFRHLFSHVKIFFSTFLFYHKFPIILH
jgi:hypothetical protein